MNIGSIRLSKKLTTVIFAIVVLLADQWLDIGVDDAFRETLASIVKTYLVVQGGADGLAVGFDARTRQLAQLKEQGETTPEAPLPGAEDEVAQVTQP